MSVKIDNNLDKNGLQCRKAKRYAKGHFSHFDRKQLRVIRPFTPPQTTMPLIISLLQGFEYRYSSRAYI